MMSLIVFVALFFLLVVILADYNKQRAADVQIFRVNNWWKIDDNVKISIYWQNAKHI